MSDLPKTSCRTVGGRWAAGSTAFLGPSLTASRPSQAVSFVSKMTVANFFLPATNYETMAHMSPSQKLDYLVYKTKLKRDVNDDWRQLNHDIWVSFFPPQFFLLFFYFQVPLVALFIACCDFVLLID